MPCQLNLMSEVCGGEVRPSRCPTAYLRGRCLFCAGTYGNASALVPAALLDADGPVPAEGRGNPSLSRLAALHSSFAAAHPTEARAATADRRSLWLQNLTLLRIYSFCGRCSSVSICALGNEIGNICSLRVFRSLNPITASLLLEQGGRLENHKNFL